MTRQPEALRLARKFEEVGFVGDHKFSQDRWCREAAVELRRLHAENQQLHEQMAAIGAGGVEPLRKAAKQNIEQATPIAWYVTGCSTMLDEHDAKAEAKRCGGSAKAVPLYTAPPALAATQPTQQGLDALTPAARDVLAERQRQIETEGWKAERDDVYDTGEIALAAACYAAHSASCAAIKAPHTAPGVFVRTRSAQDFVGEMWPWSEDWWKPSGHRRNLEKAGALILAEIERIDRATLAAQAKQGEAQQ